MYDPPFCHMDSMHMTYLILRETGQQALSLTCSPSKKRMEQQLDGVAIHALGQGKWREDTGCHVGRTRMPSSLHPSACCSNQIHYCSWMGQSYHGTYNKHAPANSCVT